MKNPNPSCQVCGEDRETRVSAIPGVPWSAAYCNECFDANAHSYDIVVDKTWAVGGYEDCADWWKALVDDTLTYLEISHEDFNKDVANAGG